MQNGFSWQDQIACIFVHLLALAVCTRDKGFLPDGPESKCSQKNGAHISKAWHESIAWEHFSGGCHPLCRPSWAIWQHSHQVSRATSCQQHSKQLLCTWLCFNSLTVYWTAWSVVCVLQSWHCMWITTLYAMLRGSEPGEVWYAQLLLLFSFKTPTRHETERAFVRYYLKTRWQACPCCEHQTRCLQMGNDQAAGHPKKCPSDCSCAHGVHYWPLLYAAWSCQ